MGRKKVYFVQVLLLISMMLTGCRNTINLKDTQDIKYSILLTAEEAKIAGGVKIQELEDKRYLTGFENDGDRCSFQVSIPHDGQYDLTFKIMSLGGHKENRVLLDGISIGIIIADRKEFEDSTLEKIYMEKGEHTVTVETFWGWINLDSLHITSAIPVDEKIYQVDVTLVNPNADSITKNLMSYLVENYGKNIIAGQFAQTGLNSKEFRAIFQATGGKIPAMLGLDLIEYSPSRVANGSTSKSVEYAIEFWEKGGITSLCWHWNTPEKYLEGIDDEPWWRGFYKEATTIDLDKIMNGEDEEGYQLLLDDIDAIAIQLKRLEDAGVPILWRPLHEASGGWFWWGDAKSESFKKLWIIMYERLTNDHEINNLIWVWNGQSHDWYPGDEYVDIIGEDIYPGERVYNSQSYKFNQAVKYTDKNKIIAMTENSCLFDPDLAIRDRACWAWFSTWEGEFVINAVNGRLSEQYTESEMVNKVYNHENVITLDKLPDFK